MPDTPAVHAWRTAATAFGFIAQPGGRPRSMPSRHGSFRSRRSPSVQSRPPPFVQDWERSQGRRHAIRIRNQFGRGGPDDVLRGLGSSIPMVSARKRSPGARADRVTRTAPGRSPSSCSPATPSRTHGVYGGCAMGLSDPVLERTSCRSVLRGSVEPRRRRPPRQSQRRPRVDTRRG
jgi:hypothetical protein